MYTFFFFSNLVYKACMQFNWYNLARWPFLVCCSGMPIAFQLGFRCKWSGVAGLPCCSLGGTAHFIPQFYSHSLGQTTDMELYHCHIFCCFRSLKTGKSSRASAALDSGAAQVPACLETPVDWCRERWCQLQKHLIPLFHMLMEKDKSMEINFNSDLHESCAGIGSLSDICVHVQK